TFSAGCCRFWHNAQFNAAQRAMHLCIPAICSVSCATRASRWHNA
ncbi:hypothetical protein A2U01_0114909, partial [Trifolium medium]|nr:hypothetical protein [Trifolium medium]